MNISGYRCNRQLHPSFFETIKLTSMEIWKFFINLNCFLLLLTLFSTVYVTGNFSIFAEFWFFLFKGVICMLACAFISTCTISPLIFHLVSRKYRIKNNSYRQYEIEKDVDPSKRFPGDGKREDEKLSEYLERIQPCPCCGNLGRRP